MRSLIKALALSTLSSFLFFLSSYFVHAQAQDAYIIVHALNPEGIEIASIDGVSRNSVEIYDGNSFLGYSAYDQWTHNQPIAIIPCAHTIRAVFNGITLEKNIYLQPAETKEAVFIFRRAVFDLPAYIYECNLSSFIQGSWSGITLRIEDDKRFSYNQWGTNVHFEDPYSGSGSYSAAARLQFSLSGIDYNWYNYAYYDIYINPVADRPPETPYWAASTFTDSGNYLVPSRNIDFVDWYVQYNYSGNVKFFLDGWQLNGNGTLLVNAGRDSTLRIVLGNPLFVWGGNVYAGDNYLWRTFAEGGL